MLFGLIKGGIAKVQTQREKEWKDKSRKNIKRMGTGDNQSSKSGLKI